MRPLVERLLWVAASALALLALHLSTESRATGIVGSALPELHFSSPMGEEGAGGAAQRLMDGNPFRHDRRPATVPFEPHPVALSQPFSAPAALPVPVLLGIAGPPWRAVLESVVGRDGGVVVRPGDAVGPFRVRTIDLQGVVLVSSDTSVTLTLRSRWP